MDKKISDITGLEVVSVKSGKTFNRVSDIIFNGAAQKIIALTIGKDGLSEKNRLIEFGDIKSLGEDVIIVENDEVVKKSPEDKTRLRPPLTYSHLRQMKVLTKEGKLLGKISDAEFNPQSGEIHKYEISRGPIEDLRFGRKKIFLSYVVKVGENNIIVEEP